ncbi:Mediator of RNA polymerase II transcription subunit 33B [Hirschfeldia incana]|nr:Mediator of RNA polymerase II transcription subunit 33B [Hirschfeldia incana]
MAVAPLDSQQSMWESITSLVRLAQEKNVDPVHWALELRSTLSAGGISLPSPELAHLLVSHIFWENHTPLSWKLLEKAISLSIVPPLLVLALLSHRVIPNRKHHPAAYRLYLELLKRHAFSLLPQIRGSGYHRTMTSIDNILHLSDIFGLPNQEPGSILLAFLFSILWQLVDASLDDEGLLELTSDKSSKWPHDMEIDGLLKRNDNHGVLEKANTEMAINLIQFLLENKVTSRILHLASQNMSTHWEDFSQRFRVLTTKSLLVRNSKHINPEALTYLASHTRKFLGRESKTIPGGEFHALVSSGSMLALTSQHHGTSGSALWLPIDLFFEDIMDGTQAAAASAVENLTGLVKALQAVNSTTWHDAFLALWLAALRLVQRERDPIEGPVPRTDTFLCVLLSVTPLAVANIIEEEESQWIDQSASNSPSNQWKEKKGKCRQGLVNSLQQLGDYESLLTPPLSVQSVANQAAAKAVMFVSGITNGNGSYENTSKHESASACSGNMRHLVVEACISRNLLDTSAYLWPGFVNGGTNQVPQGIAGNVSCWSLLMKGSSLTPSLTNSLITTPASSLAEIEKIYEIATTGSEDEKIAAASILCGASLFRGWSIQEHVIIFIVTLLSPKAPANISGSYSHLINCAPFLNVLLVGISPVDCVQIFSLHGVVPLLAGALMPICEAFGSGIPNITWTLPTGEVISSHAVFSTAFILLLRLWRFDHPPLDYVLGDVPPVGPQSSPEYLLLVRNCRLECFGKSPKDRMARRRFSKVIDISVDPIFMDSFPSLKQWYRQHQECMASILSELKTGSPVHHIVDSLLSMMFKKTNKGGSQSLTPSSGSSSLSTSGVDDSSDQLKIPGWDILEAAPFVLDAALTACAHGSLSPRELATGLKTLADFLPATLGTMVSYFSSEVTRGLWKPVSMNGTDWPSPAANLASVEQQIELILAATGVDVPRLPADGISAATLPLPLAALVSLTITYKLEKATERFLVLVGPALDALAAACPWPCMPIVTSLWTQKVKRWSDFLIFSASRTVFHHNSDAVIQLLRSCFTCTLGLKPTSQLCSYGGVGALLGHGFGSLHSGGISTAAPGILYIKVHRSIRDVMFLTEEILSLLMFSVKSIATTEKQNKTRDGLRYGIGQVSLSQAMTRVKLAASLGASLVWISGGLNLVQALIKETLPSWFISVHGEEDELGGGMVPMLRGYALAYFAILSSAFAWGVDSSSPASKRRPRVLWLHLEFLVSALEGKISLGCDWATWQAYVTGFVSLMVECTPAWVVEVDVEVIKRLSKSLRQWNEQDLALALLCAGGLRTMGTATELIVETCHQL